MKKKLIISSLVLISYGLKAQNLVQNWSFEDTIPCIGSQFWGAPESAPPWYTAKASPDYFSLDYCGGGAIGFGFQTPKTGNALVGFCTYLGSLPNFCRECFGQPLADTLIAGHKYCVSFYVSAAESAKYVTDGIHALFTDFMVTEGYIGSFIANPQIQNPAGNIIYDTANWVLISGDFVAQGGEHYITIGNLKDDANTQVDSVPWGNGIFSYYYIDDISVTDCTVGIEETMQQEDVLLSPSLAQEYVTIEYKPLAGNSCRLEVFSSIGSRVMEQTLPKGSNKQRLTVSQLPPGVYYVRLQWAKQTAVGRFVKQ